jgi:hypothetical protein
MADAKAKDVNKSEEIRKVAASMKAKGEKPRPVTIITALGKQGIEVSSPQVSMVLKRMGFRPRKRRKGGKAAAARPAAATAKKPVARAKAAAAISVDDLLAAKKVAEKFGSADQAIKVLEALKRFEG